MAGRRSRPADSRWLQHYSTDIYIFFLISKSHLAKYTLVLILVGGCRVFLNTGCNVMIKPWNPKADAWSRPPRKRGCLYTSTNSCYSCANAHVYDTKFLKRLCVYLHFTICSHSKVNLNTAQLLEKCVQKRKYLQVNLLLVYILLPHRSKYTQGGTVISIYS